MESNLLELHIVRHGKSSWDYPHIADIDRPLTERGIENAHQMAQRFLANYHTPDLIITSSAARAVHTCLIFARILHVPFEQITINDLIYNGTDDEILGMIHSTPPGVKRLMIFGHNPAFTDLANRFLQHKIDNLPTAGIVSLHFNAPDWLEINRGNMVSEFFDFPKRHT